MASAAASLALSALAVLAARSEAVLAALRVALELPESARARWIDAAGAPLEDLDLAVLDLAEGLGDEAARRRFEAHLASALEALDARGRVAVAPKAARPSEVSLAALYLDAGRVARRLEERGLAFVREVPLHACEGRRAAMVFERAAPSAALDPDRLHAFEGPLGSRRFALLAEAPSRDAALRALHDRGLERGVIELYHDERWASGEQPAPSEILQTEPTRLRAGVPLVPLEAGVLDGALVVDALATSLDPRGLLDTLHRALRGTSDLWILERCEPGNATALERMLRRRVDPQQTFRMLIAAGFAVRGIEERDGAITLHATRSGRAAVEPSTPKLADLTALWRERGLPRTGRAHVAGRRQWLDPEALRAIGFSDATVDPLVGPSSPVELLVVDGSRHPELALFLDRPSEHLARGGWLCICYDAKDQAPERYGDPDRLVSGRGEMSFSGEWPGVRFGYPDGALWFFKRP